MLDNRRIPARKTVAAAHLREQVEAQRYEEGTPKQVLTSLVNLKTNADPDGPLATQLLAGEGFMVYDELTDLGLSWGQSERDGYVGFVATNALSEKSAGPLVPITSLAALVYAKPLLRAQLLGAYSFGSRVEVLANEGPYTKLAGGGYIPSMNLDPLESTDFVAVAERFLGVPYLWGGRSYYGLDCSALVQISLQACGHEAPRDSDMQEKELGQPSDGAFQRGDLVFWDTHVGIMRDAEIMLHANAHHMAVASEPIKQAQARILAKDGGDITTIRRL